MRHEQHVIQVEPPKLHTWQKDFIRMLDIDQREELDKQRIYVIKSGRQVGKSFTMMMLLLRQSINFRQSVSWYVSPTLGQARKVFRELSDLIEGAPFVKSINKSELIIFFTNKAEIHFGSAEQGDGLRGNTVKYRGLLLIDEAAFQPDLFVSGVLFPFCNVYRRPIIMVSTPLFREGLFYELFNSKEDNIRSFDVMDYDLSFFRTDEQISLYEKTFPKQRFISEVRGDFITANSEVFGDFDAVCSNKYIKDLHPQYYIGIDWGAGLNQDSTAVVVFNGYRQMVELQCFNDCEASDTIERVASIIEKYNKKQGALQKVTVEKNSIGNVFLQMLRKRLPNVSITPFNTTNESKNKIINTLQVGIQEKNIQLLDDKELKYQFSCYQLERTKMGKMTFNAKAGAHDDIVMATAIAYYSVKNQTYSFT